MVGVHAGVREILREKEHLPVPRVLGKALQSCGCISFIDWLEEKEK